MPKLSKRFFKILLLAILAAGLLGLVAAAAEEGEYVSNVYSTFWSLLPPIIAIALALITKEVYASLFIGILTGALLHSNFNPVLAWTTMFERGFVEKIADSWNVGILIFLVILGILVVLMNRAGGSEAYGRWASGKIKTREGALGATFALGCLIFVDDYFNCLTVGSVMRPVTDRFGISRAKLAYIIDATAAPICMIAPISSWAAAVAGVAKGYSENGLDLFIRAIPYNFYSILTIAMIIFLIVSKFDFGPMALHEKNAMAGDLYTTPERPYADLPAEKISSKGKVFDLVFPVIALVVCCVIGMIYTGGFFEGTSFVNSFAECDAALGLSLGSFLALIIAFFVYVPRRVLSFKEFCEAIPEGFKAMVPAILILTFAWTLSGMTGLLGGDVFVASLVENSARELKNFLPAIIFLVAVGLSFATGTSWGTFGILIPIVVGVFPESSTIQIIAISACLAGAVCGDHCSPISDTTIMSSTGAQSDHINHVSTQLPYALLAAGVSFVCYIIAGLIQNIWIVLPISLALMIGVLLLLRFALKNKKTA